jgi:hypothetical protein
MAIMEWGAVAIGIAIIFFLCRAGHPKSAPQRSVGVIVRQQQGVSVTAVLFSLVKITVLFAIYIAATTPLLVNPASYIVEWWMVIPLFDILVFCLIFGSSIPKSYSRYMERKGKKNHSPLDYLVGIVLAAVVLGGMGIHIMTVANSPNFHAWKLEQPSQTTTPGATDV